MYIYAHVYNLCNVHLHHTCSKLYMYHPRCLSWSKYWAWFCPWSDHCMDKYWKQIRMNQSCNYTSVIPSIRRISLYSYNLSLLAVARGLEVVPSPCGDLLFLESHLFSLKLLFLPYVYFVYLKKKKESFFSCTLIYTFSIHTFTWLYVDSEVNYFFLKICMYIFIISQEPLSITW